MQLKWVAPTDTFLEFGGEIGDGDAFPAPTATRTASASGAVYVHAGGDIGDEQQLARRAVVPADRGERSRVRADRRRRQRRAGQLLRQEPARDRRLRLEMGAQRQRAGAQFQAAGRVLLAPRERRSHLRHRRRARPHADRRTTGRDQSGWYVQGVYQFMPYVARRRALRPARSRQRRLRRERRYLARLAFNPQRYVGDGRLHAVGVQPLPPAVGSRARCGPGMTDNQFFVQYILTLGAHGAHKF